MKSATIALLVMSLASASHAVLLYDGSQPGSPTSQGFLTYQAIPIATFYTVNPGSTFLNTSTLNANMAGFHSYNPTLTNLLNPSFPTLDRSVGYGVQLDLKVDIEAHAVSNRAGFSLIALSNDLLGVELDFWKTQIGAQSVGFGSYAETTSLATTDRHLYDLAIVGSNYTLYADGTEILTGPLRDYSSANAPYNKPNFLFIGDNTTSAAGAVDIYSLAVVPEPTTLGLAGLAILTMSRRKRSTR